MTAERSPTGHAGIMEAFLLLITALGGGFILGLYIADARWQEATRWTLTTWCPLMEEARAIRLCENGAWRVYHAVNRLIEFGPPLIYDREDPPEPEPMKERIPRIP